MSINLRDLGWWKPDGEYAHRSNTVVLPLTDGRTIVVVADSNAPEANAINGSYGDGSDTDQIRVFEVNAGFTSGTQVAVFGTTKLADLNLVSADLYEDGSIGIAYMTEANGLRFRKVFVNSWAIGNAETVGTPTAAHVRQLDVSISSGDCVVVGVMETAVNSPKLQLKVFVQAVTGGAWNNRLTNSVMTGSDPNVSMISLSMQFGRAGSAAARPLSILIANAQLDGADAGHRLYTAIVGESGGTLANFTGRKTYLAGNMTTKWGTFPRRGFLFNSANNGEITVVIMEAADKKDMLISRYTWDSNVFTEVIPPQMSTAGFAGINKSNRFTASYANDAVNLVYGADFDGTFGSPVNYVARINRADNSVKFSGFFRWDNMESTGQDRLYPMAGTGKNAYHANSRHAMMFLGVNTNGLWHLRVHDAKAAPAPTNLAPVNASQAPSAMPELSFRASLNKKWPQARHKGVWELATNAGFSTNYRRFVQGDDKYVKIENTDIPSAYAYFSDVLPSNLALTSGTWFVRGALIDEFGKQGSWSAVNSFTLLHPPSAINRLPNSGATLDTGAVQFSWDFSDPSPTDTQSAYQIVIENNDTGAVIHDTGQVMGSVESYLFSLGAEFQGVLLRWRIRLWDADGTPGEYSPYETFTVAGPPTVVINTPTLNQTVNSGTPRIAFTPTASGDRRIVKYQVSIMQNGVVVRDSGVIAVDSPSGTQLAWRSNGDLLDDATAYSVRVMVGDQTGLIGEATLSNFIVDYVPAPNATGVSANSSSYNTDGLGFVTVSWSDAARDVDFDAWIVSRKSDLLGMDGTTVVEVGVWEEIARVTQPAASYNYLDYYAPSGYKVNYKVQQLVDRAGEFAVSGDGNIVNTFPRSEGYWIIEPGAEEGVATSFRLHNVTADDYSDEYEETEFNVIGRGRHIDSGDHLGVRGTLTAQLRNTGLTTARQKKIQLENARSAETAVYLRNPFGDVYTVRVGNLGITRLAGVGKEEFVDVSIPYSEVAE